MTQWQPIESAPINKVILVWADYMEDPELATVRSDGVVEDREPGYPSKIYGATHWMPLPEPPKTRAQVEAELAEEGYAYDP